MERDFELELKELKQNETPDLWNRIEAGLSERRVPQKRMVWRNWGIVAAACLCVVILFPVMMIRFTGSAKSGNRDCASSDEDRADGFMSGAVEENAASAPTEGSADGWMNGAEENAGADAAAGGMPKDGAAAAEEESDADLPELEIYSLTDGQILEEAVVRILRVDTVDGQDIYTAVVAESDADNILAEEMQIGMICDGGSEYTFPRGARDETALKIGESYSVTLRYETEYGQNREGESEENGGDVVFYAVMLSVVEE